MNQLHTSSRRALLLGIASAVSAAACGSSSSPTAPSQNGTWIADVPFSTTDLTVGTGAEATNGSRLVVDYAGWLYSTATADNKGVGFDSSSGRGPLQFVLGAGNVIRGWDQGLAGMRVGGIRRLTIPPELAYGAAGNGTIPPNATLVFEVRLNDILVSAT